MRWRRELSRQISEAYYAGQFDEFVRLLKKHPRQLYSHMGTDVWLQKAAGDGNLPLVKVLVELGVDVNETEWAPDQFSYEPEGPIQRAASGGHLEVVRWLLDHGAKINFEFNGQRRCMPLVGAATQGHLDVVKLLVERGADINATYNGVNAVSQAENYGQFAVRDYLLSVGGKDMQDVTPPNFPAAHKLLRESMIESEGPIAEWHTDVPGDPAVTIHLCPATDEGSYETLFTIGLSDKNLPLGQFRYTNHELRMMLKPGWSLTDAALQDPLYNWPVEELKRLVIELRAGDRWPDEPILFMNGNPSEPLAPGTKLSGWLALHSLNSASFWMPADYRVVTIWDLFPVFAEEADYVRQHGQEALVERFEERNIPLYVDPQRENVAV